MLRIVRWSAVGLLVCVVAVTGVLWLGERQPQGPAGGIVRGVASLLGSGGGSGVTGGLAIGGPFSLVGTDGNTVTDAQFRGRWMLVYFGYTFCPDVCPTELQAVAATLDKLGPDAKEIAPLFITIDPARDTPSVLAGYTKLFDSRLIGLTGTAAQIQDVAREYRVYYAKIVQKDSSLYLMDHSSFVYLMGPDGRFRSLIRPGEQPDEMAATIEDEMRKQS
jgi:protein SCO1